MEIVIIDKIGEGNFGEIYKVKDSSGKIFAVKMVEPSKLKYIELDILTRLRSPYLIKSLHDPIIEIKDRFGIKMELKENSLRNLNAERIPYLQLKRIILSCLLGLKCMNEKGFIHHDIALRNILYSEKDGDYIAYIGDFGMSLRCINAYVGVNTSRVISGRYTPYEILVSLTKEDKNFRYSDKTDVWSLGICFLELLGSKFRFQTIEKQIEFFKEMNEDYIEERIRAYNNNKMSQKEELYLKELIVNMLRLDPDERISTKEINSLGFVKNYHMNYECILNKPKEMFYIPFLPEKSYHGIERINNFFKKHNKLLIDRYFLSVQIFLRILNTIEESVTQDYFYSLIDDSISSALNYYSDPVSSNFNAAILLHGEVGFNPYFYNADYLDDLIILQMYLTNENNNFLSMFNFINPFELYQEFRKIYKYNNIRTKDISYKDFISYSDPSMIEKTDTSIIRNIDYSNIDNSFEKNKKSEITKYKDIEKEFRDEIIDIIIEKTPGFVQNNNINVIEIVNELIKNPEKITSREDIKNLLKEKNMTKKFRNISKYFNYGIINLDINRNIEESDPYSKFVIVLGNKTSLLHVDEKERIATHYYSDSNNNIKEFYEKNNYKYAVNFDFGIGTCCKFIEACIIFIVYYNNLTENLNFNFKCLSDETLFVMMLFLLH